jgi:hypothetical protein
MRKMRLRIDISTVRFRVAGVARPRQVSRNDTTQKTTPDSDGRRPIWTVRLLAIDTQAGTTEQIFVEVAGDMPQLVVDEIATVQGLTYAPWATVKTVDGRQRAEIMRAFRADSIALEGSTARRTAA